MKRLLLTALIAFSSPALAQQSKLPPCPENQNKIYNKCFGTKYLTSIDGTATGEWKKDQLNGQAILKAANGWTYEGEWKMGQRHGFGKSTEPTEKGFAIYEGNWRYDKANGQGTFTKEDGSTYVGNYINDKRNGNGVYTSVDGSKYTGEWKDGMRTGKGIQLDAKDNLSYGIWYHDTKVINIASEQELQSIKTKSYITEGYLDRGIYYPTKINGFIYNPKDKEEFIFKPKEIPSVYNVYYKETISSITDNGFFDFRLLQMPYEGYSGMKGYYTGNEFKGRFSTTIYREAVLENGIFIYFDTVPGGKHYRLIDNIPLELYNKFLNFKSQPIINGSSITTTEYCIDYLPKLLTRLSNGPKCFSDSELERIRNLASSFQYDTIPVAELLTNTDSFEVIYDDFDDKISIHSDYKQTSSITTRAIIDTDLSASAYLEIKYFATSWITLKKIAIMADDFRWELPVPNPTRHVLRHDLIFENELYPLTDEHIYALNKMATAKTTKIRFYGDSTYQTVELSAQDKLKLEHGIKLMNYVNKNFKKNSNKVDLISTPPPASPAQQEANINKTPEIPYLKQIQNCQSLISSDINAYNKCIIELSSKLSNELGIGSP